MFSLPFVICGGKGDGDCLILCIVWLLAPAVDGDGRSSDEQRYSNK